MKLFAQFCIFILLALVEGCTGVDIKPVLENLDKDCVRHYAGSFGGGMVGTQTGVVSFQIDCQPGTAVQTTTTTTKAAPAPGGGGG